jgi:hypothetical protein
LINTAGFILCTAGYSGGHSARILARAINFWGQILLDILLEFAFSQIDSDECDDESEPRVY